MSQIPGTNNSSNSNGASSAGGAKSFNEVDMNDFLKLMIAELQNQDPLNPLDNAQLVAQISQIREVGATDKLTKTLDSVLLGQNISSATNLIGAEIDAVSDDNQRVTGMVDRVSVTDGQPKLHLDLNPRVTQIAGEGEIEAGEYEYRVVWQEEGTTFAIDPLATVEGKKLKIAEGESAALISNLPTTASTKQIFRRTVGEQDFRLVGQMTDAKASTYLDATATEDLSNLVLTGTPQAVEPKRTFTVSLKNVGEIRPPRL